MRRTLMAMAVVTGAALATPGAAEARVSVWLGFPGVSIYGGPPVYAAPPVAVAPPYCYAPPAYYAPPPVVVAPPYWRRPYWGYGPGYRGYGPAYRGHKWKGRPPGWVKHGRW